VGGVVTSFEPTVAVDGTVDSTPTEIPPTPTPEKMVVQLHKQGKVAVSDWLLANILIIGISLFFSWLTHRHMSAKWNFLIVLFIGVGGYLAYLLVALGLSGSGLPLSESGSVYVAVVVAIGMLIGLGIGMLYYLLKTRKQKLSQNRNQQG